MIGFTAFLVILIVVIIVVAAMLIASTDENSSFSDQAMKPFGVIIFVVSIILFLMLVNNITSEANTVLRACYDNNVTLDTRYDGVYEDFKVSDYRKSLTKD